MLKRNSPVTAAVALGLLLTVAGLAVLLLRPGDRLAGTNSLVAVSGVTLQVPPQGTRCSREVVPGGADRVRLYPRTARAPGPPLEIAVRRGRQTMARGRAPGGYRADATVDVPVRPRTREVVARVCVRNLGARPVGFAGNLTPLPPAPPAASDPEAIRLDWLLPGRPTWAEISPEVASRFAAAKPTFVGAWTFWAVWALVGTLGATAVALFVRETRR